MIRVLAGVKTAASCSTLCSSVHFIGGYMFYCHDRFSSLNVYGLSCLKTSLRAVLTIYKSFTNSQKLPVVLSVMFLHVR